MVARGEEQADGIAKEFGMDMYTLQYLKWINNKDFTIQHMKLCSMLCGSLNGKGVWGRMDICIFMAESLCYSPETITTVY